MWTEESIATLRDLAGKGFSASVIAEYLGTSKSAVIGKCSRNGIALSRTQKPIGRGDIELARRAFADGGATLPAVARLLGRTTDSVRHLCDRYGIKWKRQQKGLPHSKRVARPYGVGKDGGLAVKIRARHGGGVMNGDGIKDLAKTEVDIPRVTLLDLEPHHCRWPVGHPKDSDFGFCGLPRDGSPYCACHHARASAGRISAIQCLEG